MATFPRVAIVRGQRLVEVDEHGAGEVAGLVRRPPAAAVEVPADVDDDGAGRDVVDDRVELVHWCTMPLRGINSADGRCTNDRFAP